MPTFNENQNTLRNLRIRILMDALCGEDADPIAVQEAVDALNEELPTQKELLEGDFNDQLWAFERDCREAALQREVDALYSKQNIAKIRMALEAMDRVELDQGVFRSEVLDNDDQLRRTIGLDIIRRRAIGEDLLTVCYVATDDCGFLKTGDISEYDFESDSEYN